MRRGRVVTGLLLVVGLGSALLGQFYFANWREYVWDGVFLWAVALFSFGWLLWRTERKRTGQRRRHRRLLAWLPGPPARVVAVAGGTGLVLVAGWLARQRPDTADFGGVFLLWLVGGGCFLLGFVPLAALFHWRPDADLLWGSLACFMAARVWSLAVHVRRFT